MSRQIVRRHCTEEELIFHHYGDAAGRFDVAGHLRECGSCSAELERLVEALKWMDEATVPPRDDRYGLEVWQRIRHRLPERDGSWALFAWRWSGAVIAVAAALLVIVGYVAGRSWPPGGSGQPVPAAVAATAALPDEQMARRRVLLLSVADHFDESDRVLTEIVNGAEGRDLAAEQAWADELLSANRLYRTDAVAADEPSVAAVLDELERALLEIVHSPSRVTDAQLDDIKRRIDSATLLFKVRVMSDELRRDTGGGATERTSRSTSQVS